MSLLLLFLRKYVDNSDMQSRASRNFTVLNRSDIREIALSRGVTDNTIFTSNRISTGKYSLITLLPKNLFEQFKRLANIWFLVVSTLQLLPLELSPTSSWATIAPLALVLTVTLLKDAYLDFRRHQSDHQINSRTARRWSEAVSQFSPTKWKDVAVGDILLLSSELVPADVVVLATSDKGGMCYIDTANLDGESNLKVKSALSDTAKIFKSVESEEFAKALTKLEEGVVYVEKPNNRLYRFEGCIRLKEHIRAIPIDNSNVILRGCEVTRTHWVLGLVVFTGPESKLMMNSKAPPHKRSNVEKRVNKYLFFVFALLLATAGLSTIVSVGKTYDNPKLQKTFSGQESASSGLNFITFLILYNGLVPISLYVTMDIVRVIQAKFIQWDMRLYHEESDRCAIVKSSDLNEDLGQIEYIFSDKTGTLTENRMMFKTCSIRGKVYGTGGEDKGWNNGCTNTHSKFRFADASLIADLGRGDSGVKEFLEILSLCHTVTVSGALPEPLYQASSPDEEALVIAAHCFGYTLMSAHSGVYSVQVGGVMHEYRVLGINEFNSTRKRMSIVLKPLTEPHRPAMLYCKGADNVMLNLCYFEQAAAQVRMINQQLYDFSMKGLRTLVLAQKELTEAEAEDFERKYTFAKNAISEREKRLEEVAEEFEVDMDLVGITAIEDKIQEGVPEAISILRAAGIKIWVLTGDKQETALNIGFSCGLLTTAMTVVVLNGEDKDDIKSKLMYYIGRFVYTDPDDQHIRRVHSNFSQPSNTPVSPFMNDNPANRPFALIRSSKTVGENSHVDLENINIGLVVSGDALQCILADKQCSKWFTILACISKTVVFCRATPLQKADVVRLVKEHIPFGPLTMSIGDGANDVSMLQEAHVGVGIIGNEGMQAVNCSDYAIARFRHVLPLLFLHGRWNYHRITKVILYSFFKNFLLILPMFYYSFLNGYSGTALYDSWLIMTYNVIFTSLPIIILGTTDTDLTPDRILKSPSLYTSGILHRYFNATIFLRWILMAVVHSLAILVLIVLPSSTFQHPSSYTENLTTTGTVSYFAIVQAVTFVLFTITKSWTKLFLGVTLGSLFLFYAFVFFYDYVEFPAPNLAGVADALFTYPMHLIAMWLTPWIMVLWNLLDCFARHFCRRGDKISPEQTYLVSQPKSVMLRAGKIIKLNQIVSFNGLSVNIDNGDGEDYSCHKVRLHFRDSDIEKTYQKYQITRKLRFMQVMFWIIFLFLAGWTGFDMSTVDRGNEYTGLRMFVLCGMLMFCILAHTKIFTRYFQWIILIVVAGGMGLKIASDVMLENDGSMSTAVVPIITFVLFNVSTFLLVLLNSTFLCAYMLKLIITLARQNGPSMAFFIIVCSYLALLVGIMSITGYVGYVLEKESRSAFVGRKKLDAEVKRGQDILSNLLPKFVKDRVIMGERDIADDQGTLTILFCDIYDFEEMCEDKSFGLIKFLDGYFLLLDSLVDKHGLTKIETVGKTYMACGGLQAHESTLPPNLTEKHHAERVCELAFDILEQLEGVTVHGDTKLSVKIGIHTGQTYSGVVGLHKPQFSLVGNTVNYASRMCAFGQKDRIQISMETYKYVRGLDYDFTPSFAKIKEGLVDTMLLAPRSEKPRSRLSISTAVSPQQQPIKTSPPPLESRPSLLVPSNTLILDTKPALDTSQAPLIPEKKNFVDGPLLSTLQGDLSDDLKTAAKVEVCPWSRENEAQRNYRSFYIEQHRKSVKKGLWVSIFVYLFDNAVFLSAFGVTNQGHGSPTLVALRLLCVSGMLILVLWFSRCARTRYMHWVMLGLYAGCSLVSVLTLYTISEEFMYVIVLEVMYTNVVYNHISGVVFKHIFMGGMCILTPWLCIIFTEARSMSKSGECSFFIIFFMVLNSAASYAREMQSRRSFILNRKQEEVRARTEDLLTKLMPKRVYNILQSDLNASPFDIYENTTILYADICGFTVWAKHKSPKEVVGMLGRLYSAFDRCTVKHQVYKVHTIGDCYVVLGLNDYQDNQRDHHSECVNVVEMAIDMIREIKAINAQVQNLDIGMRIGIHTGTIMGGFAGKIVVRYDIYGPAVTKANKMESGGLKNNINVSEKTKMLLSQVCPDRFHFVPNEKEIVYEAKGKRLQGYFLDPVKSVDFF